MSERRFLHWALVALFCIAATVLVGCKTSKEGRQAKVTSKMVTSLNETRQELVKADQEVDQVLAAMTRLEARPKDLKQEFKAYSEEVSDVAAQSDAARERADEMRERWQDYVATWEDEMERVSSPELRASAAERRETVRANYDHLRNAAREMQTAYGPFVRELRDIERSLSLDLTPAGVEATKPAFEKARETGTNLQEKIDTFVAELDKVRTEERPSRRRLARSRSQDRSRQPDRQ